MCKKTFGNISFIFQCVFLYIFHGLMHNITCTTRFNEVCAILKLSFVFAPWESSNVTRFWCHKLP
jgi:hypothetical protein